MIKCKWCLNEFEKLAKAHIIPSAIIKNYSGNEGRIHSPSEYSKLTRTGLYDTTINCSSCEKQYQSIDSEAIKILVKDFNNLIIDPPDDLKNKIVQIPKSFTQEIKRFLLYILWKCSVSSLPELKNICLGKYEEVIKEALIQNKIFEDDEFSFVGQFHENPIGLALPFKMKRKDFEGRNYYHIDLNSFGFNLKVDSRKSSDLYDSIQKLENLVFIKFRNPPKNKLEGIRKILEKVDKKYT